MAKGPPKLVTVARDDYHAEYVGRTRDGRQFFLTTPFVPGGREFVALYLFDKSGQLRSATIEDFGSRHTLDERARRDRFDALLASLGEVTYQRIRVAPFRLEMFGVEFGFIPRARGTGRRLGGDRGTGQRHVLRATVDERRLRHLSESPNPRFFASRDI